MITEKMSETNITHEYEPGNIWKDKFCPVDWDYRNLPIKLNHSLNIFCNISQKLFFC